MLAETWLWAVAQQSNDHYVTIASLALARDEFNVCHKAMCADSYFHEELLVRWHDYNNINPMPLGPNTPWPNRAEGAVLTLKHRATLLIKSFRRCETTETS